MECNRNSQNPKRVPSGILVVTGRMVKRDHPDGCVSFFCTSLSWNRRGGRRTPEERFVPGIASAKTTSRLLREGLSRRFAGSVSRWMRQPIQPCPPKDEGPKGAGQALLALCSVAACA